MVGLNGRPLGKVELIASDAGQRRGAADLVERLGYVLIEEGSGVGDVVLLVARNDEAVAAYFSKLSRGDYPVPVIVFGPSRTDGDWRRVALENGAFACLAFDAAVEERACVLMAASRFRAAQMEVEMLRRESDLLCTRLLTHYGEETQKLRAAQKERREAQEALESIKNRILRSVL